MNNMGSAWPNELGIWLVLQYKFASFLHTKRAYERFWRDTNYVKLPRSLNLHTGMPPYDTLNAPLQIWKLLCMRNLIGNEMILLARCIGFCVMTCTRMNFAHESSTSKWYDVQSVRTNADLLIYLVSKFVLGWWMFRYVNESISNIFVISTPTLYVKILRCF